jgi:hypothetical protein
MTEEKPKTKRIVRKKSAPAGENASPATKVLPPVGPGPVKPGQSTPEFPYLCPGEKYPITRAVCIGRQEKNYESCLECPHLIKSRRPRKRDFKEE